MNCLGAVKAMKEGKKVRRKCCSPMIYIKTVRDSVQYFEGYNVLLMKGLVI